MAEQAGGLGILRTFSDNLETSQGRASRHYRRKKMKRRSRSVSEQIDELKATDGSVGKESECKDDDDNNSSQRRLSNALKSPSQKSGSSKTPKWKSSNGGNYNNMDENSNDAQQGDERTLSRASSASLGFSFSIAGPAMTHPHVLDARKTAGVCSPGNRNNQEKNNDVILDVRDPRPKSTPPLPIAVKFSDVKYKVILNRTNFSFCKGPWNKTSVFMEKEILHGVTGSVLPGEVLALMGPSGSGKTTFINLLGGRIHQNLSGTITYNSQPYSKCLKRRIGFVQQDDILFPHLTVVETLVYAALLRLPNTLTRYQKRERAFDVICELGLERCQDTIIGGPFVKGVSGGERKRVCIGHEILIDPSILILDEPTSGLDSTTALRIVQLLHNIAKTGRTILTTIHQPSSRLFHKFDKLILLGEGNPIYFGKASDAIQYFSSIGFSPLITMNPADFLLDLANGDINDVSVPKDLTEQIANKNPEGNQAEKPSSKDVLKHLVSSYHSHNAPEAKAKLLASESINEKSELVLSPAHEWGASWCEQFSILFKRGLKERRHEYLSGLRFAQVLSVALVLGLLWWQSKINTPKRLEDQTGLLFFIAVFWGFFPVFMAIFTFPQERAMLAKERGVDMYRLSAYFMARNLSDMPLDLLLPVIFMGIVYFMTNLRMTAMAFSLTLLTVFLSIIASQGLGLAIGASFMDVKKATTIASVAMMTFMLAGGFFVQHVPNFMRWIKYLSFNFYTYRILIKIQYDYDQQYDCSSPIGCQSISTSPFLKGIPLDGGLTEAAIMLAMAIGYRAIAYISLRRMSLRV